jgi:hypothetical protein
MRATFHCGRQKKKSDKLLKRIKGIYQTEYYDDVYSAARAKRAANGVEQMGSPGACVNSCYLPYLLVRQTVRYRSVMYSPKVKWSGAVACAHNVSLHGCL